jgi:K+-transporting ATPase c subunit
MAFSPRWAVCGANRMVNVLEVNLELRKHRGAPV